MPRLTVKSARTSRNIKQCENFRQNRKNAISHGTKVLTQK